MSLGRVNKRIRLSLSPATFILTLAMFAGVLGAQRPNKPLERLLEDHWDYSLSVSPVFASTLGDRGNNNKLGDATLSAIGKHKAHLQTFLARAKRIQTTSTVDRINLSIFTRLIEDDLKEIQFETHLIPITNRWGFHVGFVELPNRHVFDSVYDYRDYISRLKDYSRFNSENIALMREGIKKGMVLPAVVLEGYNETIEPHIVDNPTDSLLYAPFKDFKVDLSAEEQTKLREEAQAAIREAVVPAFQTFLDFMNDEYYPACTGSIAASTLPNGREYYRYRVKHYTTLDLTPEQVHETGKAEVARIFEEMTAIQNAVNFEGTRDEFVSMLRSDKRFYPTDAESYMKEVAYILKRMDGELPKLFGRLPRAPYGIKVIPDYLAPKTTTAYYSQPSGDGKRAGFYYVNTYNLPSRPLYQLEALSLHEAVPGHHLQLAIQQELEGLPPLRKFNGFTAFVEGWALYAERLGKEVGFYEDPYSDYGRLSMEMWRACRLVVDTGMHYMGWTRQRAIQYMADHTALSLHNITAEVDRYISWPGQALAYKTGEIAIRTLRKSAEEQLGDSFDIREFHDAVLENGSVPLDTLDELITNWIEAKKGNR